MNTLNDTIAMVCAETRNYFNETNSPDLPSDYPEAFLTLCGEIHEFIQSPEGKPSSIVGESVAGLHSWTAAGAGGVRAGWAAVFADRLRHYRKMFTETRL